MPQERHEARAWIDRAEANDRKNGRVCDKVMVALPRELDTGQRMELVRRFGHEATGRPVACAFDAHNLRPVAEALRRKYPDAKIVIASDDDRARAAR